MPMARSNPARFRWPSLTPERTYSPQALSKCRPGLRVSFLLTPDTEAAAQLAAALRATVQMPAFLMVAVVARSLRVTAAPTPSSRLYAAKRRLGRNSPPRCLRDSRPSDTRTAIMSGCRCRAAGAGLEFASHVQRQGLRDCLREIVRVGETQPHAIRVSLGAASSRSELVRGLEILAGALRSPAAVTRVV